MEEKNVKRGCLDCADYKTELKKEPCKSCVRWSEWRYKNEMSIAQKREAND